MNAFPNVSHGGHSGQGLLQANSFSVIPAGNGCKYVVNDQSGGSLLWVLDSGPSLLVKDAGQMDVIRVSHNAGSPSVTVQDPSGNVIGSVLISTKDIKEHKKEKDSKDKHKRQYVLQNSNGQVLLLMSGKGSKKTDGSVELRIKSMSTIAGTSAPTDVKHKDKKDKDGKDKDAKDKKDKDGKDKGEKDKKDKDGKDKGEKDKKDKDGKDKGEKDKKDKDKSEKDKKDKKKEIAEVTGSAMAGIHVRLVYAGLTMPERVNVVGLIVAYMELERQGLPQGAQHPMTAPHVPGGMAHPYAQTHQGYPATGPQMDMGQHHPQMGGPQMGFIGHPPGPGSYPDHGQGQVHYHQPNY